MFGNDPRWNAGSGASFRFERNPARPPLNRKGQDARRHHKAEHIRRNIVRLNDVLRILGSRLAPSADFNIHLAARTIVIPGRDTENSCRFQMRSLANDKVVRSVSKTPRETDFRAGPMVFLPLDVQVQKPFAIDLSISRIVKVQRAACVARSLPDLPFIAAEVNRSWLRLYQAVTFRGCNRPNCAPLLRQHFNGGRRPVLFIDEERRIRTAGVRGVSPRRVRTNFCEWASFERLHPPHSASRK